MNESSTQEREGTEERIYRYRVAEMNGIGTLWTIDLVQYDAGAASYRETYEVCVTSGPAFDRRRFEGTWTDAVAYAANRIQEELEAEHEGTFAEPLPPVYGVRGDRLATVDENGNVR